MNSASTSAHRSRAARLLAVILVAALLPANIAAAQAESPTPAAREIRLSVETPAYTLESGKLRVAGYATHDLPGAPELPVWSQVVELPAGAEWSISYISTGEKTIPLPAQLAAVPVTDLDLAGPYGVRSEDAPSAVPVVDRPDAAIYGQDAFYPASLVQAGPEGIRRGQRLLPVRVFPFQYNPARGELSYHPQIEVVIRLAEHPERSSAQTIGGAQSKDAAPFDCAAQSDALLRSGCSLWSALLSRDGLRIRTDERGFYRLTYAELSAAGVPVDTLSPASFAVYYLNTQVDIEIIGGEDGDFDPGDLVVFYAEPYAGRYQNHNVYRFTWDVPAARRMQIRQVTPEPVSAPLSVITQTLHVEFDRVYYSTYKLPRAADHIFDNPLYANAATPVAEKSYPLNLDDLVTSGNAIIRAQVHGGASRTETPDQSLALYLNGHDLGAYQWDGSVSRLISIAAPSAWLAGAPSQLKLQTALAQLPAVGNYWVSPDWIEISYPATAEAEGDRLYIEGQSPPQPLAPASFRLYLPLVLSGRGAPLPIPQTVVATGFTTSDIWAYDVTDVRHPIRLTGAATAPEGGAYAMRFQDQALPGRSYFLATVAGLLAPLAIEPDAGSDLRSPGHHADYIAIVHRSLWDAVQPLLDHRATEGMTVAKVDVQDIYDEWSGGRLDPEAIRAFLSYAYHNWNAGGAPPTYVLLVGDGHYDFKSALRPGLPMLIPPYLLDIDPEIGETAADNRYVSVDGPDDFLADMEIGRIPAKTAADVTAVVNKIIAYEATTTGDWQKRAVFVADNKDDLAGNFHAISEVSRLTVPASYETSTIYYKKDASTDTTAEMKAAIRGALGQGGLYLQWFGHASKYRWGSESMFNVLDVPTLAASPQLPFTVSYSCWSGYFIEIAIPAGASSEQALGEILLLRPERGSIADFSPTGLHLGFALQKLNQGVVKAIFQDRIDRVGLVARAAKEYYFSQSGWALDLLDTQVLFGDPATRLRLP